MKTKRCKYGHKITPKAHKFDLDKFGVITTLTAFIGYMAYANIWG